MQDTSRCERIYVVVSMENTDNSQTFIANSNTNFSIVDIIGPKRDSLAIVLPITAIYILIFLTGLIGNISTCVVIARNKSMHTATNYYLFSLAISDLLLLISGLPQEVYSIWCRYPYVFGHTFCVFRGLFAETSANATVLTITAFTVERYLAICHPFLSHTMSKLSRAVKFILIIWTVAVFFAVPQALQFGVSDIIPGALETQTCQVVQVIVPHSFEFSTFVFFFTPMSLITVLYVLIGVRLKRSSRMKKTSGDSNRSTNALSTNNITFKQKQAQSSRRVLKMLVAVVVAFFVCWAPFHTQRLVAIYYTIPADQEEHRRILKVYEVVTYVSGVLYYLSTTINPLLYNIMSNKFREAFKETFARCCQLACFKSQRAKCTYSMLSRSLRRGADSGTDSSTGRDESSIQTHITLAHKISQESMNVPVGSQRICFTKRNQHDTDPNKKPFTVNTIREDELNLNVRKSTTFHKRTREGSVKFWRKLIRGKSSKSRISGVVNESRFNTGEKRINEKRHPSTSSCDISNSSLKDFDNDVLEDEMAIYLYG